MKVWQIKKAKLDYIDDNVVLDHFVKVSLFVVVVDLEQDTVHQALGIFAHAIDPKRQLFAKAG